MSKSDQLRSVASEIGLADSAARRKAVTSLAEVPGALGSFAAELAATNCLAKETVLVCSNPSDFLQSAAASNSIEIFERPPSASDLIAIAAGDRLSDVEYVFTRIICNRDFVQLLGFKATDDAVWQQAIVNLRDLFKQINAQTLSELIDHFHTEPILELAMQIASTIARRTPVIIDGTRALLAASIVFEFSVAARSWLFVADSPASPAGMALFKHRNWISLPANQVSAGDGLAGIAAISLARTAALLVRG